MGEDLKLEWRDKAFFEVLTNGIPGLEVGTGAMPRFMSETRAKELWRAEYVKAEPHHFRGGWFGLKYSIAEKGLAFLGPDHPNVRARQAVDSN